MSKINWEWVIRDKYEELSSHFFKLEGTLKRSLLAESSQLLTVRALMFLNWGFCKDHCVEELPTVINCIYLVYLWHILQFQCPLHPMQLSSTSQSKKLVYSDCFKTSFILTISWHHYKKKEVKIIYRTISSIVLYAL